MSSIVTTRNYIFAVLAAILCTLIVTPSALADPFPLDVTITEPSHSYFVPAVPSNYDAEINWICIDPAYCDWGDSKAYSDVYVDLDIFIKGGALVRSFPATITYSYGSAGFPPLSIPGIDLSGLLGEYTFKFTVTVDNFSDPVFVQVLSKDVTIAAAPDPENPSATVNPISANLSGTVSVTGTATDVTSGVESIKISAVTDPGGVETKLCEIKAPASLNPWSCSWDTTASPNGDYKIKAEVEDRSGRTYSVFSNTGKVSNCSGVCALVVSTPDGLSLTEGAGSKRLLVSLNAQPLSNVTVSLSNVDGQLTFPAGPLTFTSANWSTPQTINVAAVDDQIAEASPITGALKLSAASGDARFNGIADTTNFSVTDNDTAGFILAGENSVLVSETGETQDTFTVRLSSQPTANVVLSVGFDSSQVSLVTSNTLTFTSGNWSTPQSVTVKAVDDFIDEADTHTSNITLGVSSGDSIYNALTISDVSVSISDNDTAGFNVVGPIPNEVWEGGANATYTVVLTSQPTNNVTVHINAASDIQSIADLVFTPGDWSTPKTVTVTAINDNIAENDKLVSLVHTVTSSDPKYSNPSIWPANIGIQVHDNDTAGFILAGETSVLVSETGETQDTFTVRLSSRPTANVVLSVGFDSSQVSLVTSNTLTFTSGNWSTPQSVTVKAVDDFVDEDNPHTSDVTLGVSSGDPMYNALTIPNVSVSISDDDTSAFVFSNAGPFSVSEAGPTSATYNVHLATKPSNNVTLVLGNSDGQLTKSANLNFTPLNWQIDQTVTITAVDDADIEGPHIGTITQSVSSLDAKYASLLLNNVTFNITDNDSAGFILTDESSVQVSETGTTSDTFKIRLKAKPSSNVSIALSVDPLQLALTTPSSLVFTSTNWNTDQLVTVRAVDDALDEGGNHVSQVTFAISTADSNYSSLSIPPVNVTIQDNDSAGLVFSSTGPFTVNEAGQTSISYDVHLATKPSSDVTLALGSSDGQLTKSSDLVFTTTNWMTNQTVVITAVDDSLVELSPHTGTITQSISSLDAKYAALTLSDVTVNIIDNDDPSVVVSKPNGVSLTEGGVDNYILLKLDAQPTNDVILTITGDGQVATVDTLITFTTSNWSSNQLVNVTAVNDLIAEDNPHTGSLSISASSTDSRFNNLNIPSVQFSITDNDYVGVDVTQPVGSVSEEGETAQVFSFKLTKQPSKNVVVTVATDGQTRVAPSTVTFTSVNWNIAQNVSISAVDDDLDEGGDHTSSITVSPVANGLLYDTSWASPVSIIVKDNDTSGLSVRASSLDINEGRTQLLFVSLKAKPAGNVIVNLSSDVDIVLDVNQLQFTPLNWNLERTVQVTAVDDLVDKGINSSSVFYDLSASPDSGYKLLVVPATSFRIKDNDTIVDVQPPTGGSITAPDALVAGGIAEINFSIGTDDRGVASWRLEKSVGRYGRSLCVNFEAWVNVGGENPATPYQDTLENYKCTKYRLVVVDTSDNQTAYEAAGISRVDAIAPVGTIDEIAANSGRLDGTASDYGSASVHATVSISGPVNAVLCPNMLIIDGIWSCPYSSPSIPSGVYTVLLSITDDFGHESIIRRTWTRLNPADEPLRIREIYTYNDKFIPILKDVSLPVLSIKTVAPLTWEGIDNTGKVFTRVDWKTATASGKWSEWNLFTANAISPFKVPIKGRGATTCVRLTPVDPSGNTGKAEEHCVTVPLDDRNMVRGKNWKLKRDAKAYVGTLSVAPSDGKTPLGVKIGAYKQIKLIATTCKTCGVARITVNGKTQAIVNLRSKTTVNRKILLLPKLRANNNGAVVKIYAKPNSGLVAIDGLVITRS